MGNLLTGLTVGGLTCLAVQGGLLASVITAREEEEIEKGVNTKNPIFPTLSFLVAKLVAYSLLGFVLGAFGQSVSISQGTQIIMQFLAGVYMLAVAANLLNLHPIFRYAIIQPPRFLTRILRNQSKSKDLFAPSLLGAMTIFIPCGTTLAMEALAISSANALGGATIMAVFVLGTSPLFFGVGWLTSILGDNFRARFLKIAAFAVIYLGIMSINGALVASDSPFSLARLMSALPVNLSSMSRGGDIVITDSNGVQDVTINITATGYSPNFFKVKKDQPVKLNLSSKNAFRIPSLGIARNVGPNGNETIEFTPREAGKIAFTCSMGMYSGVIEVI